MIFMPRLWILIFIFLLFEFPLVFGYLYTGHSIRDLERNDAFFTLDEASWTATRQLSTALTYICSSTYLIGGYGVLGVSNSQMNDYFSRTYSGLPSHSMVYFSFSIWALDDWSHNQDYFILDIGTSTFNGWNSFDSSSFSPSICGSSSYKDLSNVRVFGSATHTAGSLLFKITSRFNQDSQRKSFGIRDINLMFVSGSPALTSDTMCGKASITIGAPEECSCSEGQYKSSGVCTGCDTSCSSCFGSGSSQCYECKTGYSFNGTDCFACSSNCTDCSGTGSNQCVACKSGYLLFRNNTCAATSDCTGLVYQTGGGRFCDSPCTNATQFVYWNGTCIASCNSPLQQSTTLNTLVNTCVYPCSSGKYLYWNGSCISACSSPLVNRTEGGKDFCDYPCSASQYLYWNGTCGASCISPLSWRNESGKNYCDYPCSAGQYLYWNATCASSCNSPLTYRLESGKNFCDFSCSGSNYLYWNGTCSSSCLSPLSQANEGGKNFCRYPCTALEYLYWDSTCVSTCLTPLTQRVEGGKNFCDHPCLSIEYILMNGSCLTSCDLPLIQTVSHQITYCSPPCSNSIDYYDEESGECITQCPVASTFERGLYLNCPPHSTMTFPIVRLLHYMRYIDTKLPSQLLRTSLSRGNNILSMRIIPELLTSIRQKFPNLPLPLIFEKPNVSSSFLANFLDDLILLGFLLFLELIITIYMKFPFKTTHSTFRTILTKVRILTRWTLPLILIATDIGDIFFFSTLEFRTFDSQNENAIVSLSICIVILVAAVVFLIGTLLLVRRNHTSKVKGHKNAVYASFIQRWMNYQILFGGIGEGHMILDPSFFLIYCIRQALPMLIASFLFSYPLVQIILNIIINIAMIVYIMFGKPVKKTIDYINIMLIEGMILMVNICILCLIGMDLENSQDDQVEEILGDIIIIGNYVLTFQAIAFLITKAAMTAHYAIYLGRQGKTEHKKAVWLRLAFLPFQQGAFGFEYVNMGDPPSLKIHKIAPQSNLEKYMKDVRDTIVASPCSTDRPGNALELSSNAEPFSAPSMKKSTFSTPAFQSEINTPKESVPLIQQESVRRRMQMQSPSFQSPALKSMKDPESSFNLEPGQTDRQTKASEILSLIATNKSLIISGENTPSAAGVNQDIGLNKSNFYSNRRNMIRASVFKSKQNGES